MKKFWMVLKEGTSLSSRMHETKGAAIEEAKRLCKKDGNRFYVLEAVTVVFPQTPPIMFMELDSEVEKEGNDD